MIDLEKIKRKLYDFSLRFFSDTTWSLVYTAFAAYDIYLLLTIGSLGIFSWIYLIAYTILGGSYLLGKNVWYKWYK